MNTLGSLLKSAIGKSAGKGERTHTSTYHKNAIEHVTLSRYMHGHGCDRCDYVIGMAGGAKRLAEALRKLTYIARTSGGTAGRDEALCAACDEAEIALAEMPKEPE